MDSVSDSVGVIENMSGCCCCCCCCCCCLLRLLLLLLRLLLAAAAAAVAAVAAAAAVCTAVAKRSPFTGSEGLVFATGLWYQKYRVKKLEEQASRVAPHRHTRIFFECLDSSRLLSWCTQERGASRQGNTKKQPTGWPLPQETVLKHFFRSPL